MRNRFLFFRGAPIAALALAALALSACGGKEPGPPTISPPTIGSLPNLPEGSTPGTAANVDAILEALADSWVVWNIRSEMSAVDYAEWDRQGEPDQYSFTDVMAGDYPISVSGSYKVSETGSESRGQYSEEEKVTAKVTEDITKSGVTVAEGSTLGWLAIESGEWTATRETFSEKEQIVAGLTVTTSSGSVRIILDASVEGTGWATTTDGWDTVDDDYENVNFSGSLKVYGAGDALLKEWPITDVASFYEVLELIGYGISSPYSAPSISGASPSVRSIPPAKTQAKPALLRRLHR